MNIDRLHPAVHPAFPGERQRLAAAVLALSLVPAHRRHTDPIQSAVDALAADGEGDAQQLQLAGHDAERLAWAYGTEKALWFTVGLKEAV